MLSERVRAREERAFLPEIQALRAVAVSLVVLFHLWPQGLTGGYVGVDAFFVISGFLITSHLLREVDRTGSVRLAAFYARRARRLLPASVTVLLACSAAAYLLLPPQLATDSAKEVAASALYVQNLYLAANAVTYSASNNVASPVEHFWSLSAEEQFYLVWPSLIILSCLGARRWLRGRTTTTVGVTLLGVTVVSFAASVVLTSTRPAAAYFVTPTRAWEFGLGALLVLALRKYAPPQGAAWLLRWAGFLGLGASAWLYTRDTPFPGYTAALPCLATAVIILAGDTGRWDPSTWLVSLRPVQWLGDISYSVYLWHWPLIALAPYALGRATTTADRVAVLALTLVLGHLSKRYLEDATRHLGPVRRSPRLALLAAACSMLVLVLVSGASLYAVNRTEAAVAASMTQEDGGPCVGAAALVHLAQCPEALTADPERPVVKADAPWAPVPGCAGLPGAPSAHRCYWGSGEPRKTVVLVGDSHAEHWRSTVHLIARREGWAVVEMYAGGCPATDARSVVFERRSRDGEVCRAWTRKVTDRLRQLRPAMVLTSAYAQANEFEPAGSGPAGFLRVWDEWADFTRVYVLRDIPNTGGRQGPQCLAVHQGDPVACATPRARALPPDALTEAGQVAGPTLGPRVRFVDLSRHFCDEQRCYAVVGGVPVYYDYDHMTRQFAVTLAPYLRRSL